MLKGIVRRGLRRRMENDFRSALEWHLNTHGTKIADLVAETGVSRDVINKLRQRPGSSTSVENGHVRHPHPQLQQRFTFCVQRRA